MLVSSDLTRAIQTLQQTREAFELVGPLHGKQKANIYCHHGLREVTSWTHDLPGMVRTDEGKQYTSYFKLEGGDRDPETVIGEEKVDLTNVIRQDGNEWAKVDARIKAVTTFPSLTTIEEHAKEARMWLRDCENRVLQAHQSIGGVVGEILRIVVCTHGGALNFLAQEWYGDLKKDDCGRWEWAGSRLCNLETTVFTFQSLLDEKATLRELDPDGYYKDFLGKYYRHMASERSDYRNPDDSPVDKKAKHFEFIKSKAEEVRAFADQKHEVLRELLSWTGAADFLDRQAAKNSPLFKTAQMYVVRDS